MRKPRPPRSRRLIRSFRGLSDIIAILLLGALVPRLLELDRVVLAQEAEGDSEIRRGESASAKQTRRQLVEHGLQAAQERAQPSGEALAAGRLRARQSAGSPLGGVSSGSPEWSARASAALRAIGGRTYSLDADFDSGALVAVDHDPPNSDQLQLSRGTQSDPFIWIANEFQGMATKLNVDSGAIVAHYPSALTSAYVLPDNLAGQGAIPVPFSRNHRPSRTTVDLNGDMFLVNRAHEIPGVQGSVSKIAGHVSRCVDRNNNGVIDTQTGAAKVRVDDECVVWTAKVGRPGDIPRGVAIDPENQVWVATYFNATLHKFDNTTGALLDVIDLDQETGAPPNFNRVYGLASDRHGLLYTSSASEGPVKPVLKVDPRAPAGQRVVGSLTGNFAGGPYGIAVDANGIAWYGHFNFDSQPPAVNGGAFRADFDQGRLEVRGAGTSHCGGLTRGIAIDAAGDIWLTCPNQFRVFVLDPNGTPKANYSFVGLRGLIGVAVDYKGRIWAIDHGANRALRIHPGVSYNQYPAGRTSFQQFGGSYPISTQPNPYSYSDMTGFQLRQFVLNEGTWNVVHDAGRIGTLWGTVLWNQEPQGSVPPGTELRVEVRAAEIETDLADREFETVANGAPFTGLTGRYLEVQVTFKINSGNVSPVLSDLTVIPRPQSCPNLLAFDSRSSELLLVDAGSFQEQVIGSVTTDFGAGPIPVGPLGGAAMGNAGLLFAARNTLDVASSAQLLTIDPVSGQAIPIGPIGYQQIEALAFDPAAGLLYGASVHSDGLLAIDPVSGQGTWRGPFDVDGDGTPDYGRVSALAFEELSGKLYGVDAGSGQLLEIDPSNGAAIPRAALGYPDVQALEGRIGGGLIATDTAAGRYFHVDAATGFVTELGSHARDLTGIACYSLPPAEGRIGDTVYFDFDGNGLMDGGDLGLGGIQVSLIADSNENGQAEPGEPILEVKTTDAQGHYLFGGLPEGFYVVDVDTLGILSLTSGTEPRAVALTQGATRLDVDFGFQTTVGAGLCDPFYAVDSGTHELIAIDPITYERTLIGRMEADLAGCNPAGSIGDRVWEDNDGDQAQDSDEFGIAGVTVRLYRDGNGNGVPEPGELLSAQTTDAFGLYRFENLTPAQYVVDVEQASLPLSGFSLTTANDPLLVGLAAAQDFSTADFGFRLPAQYRESIRNRIRGPERGRAEAGR